MEGKENVSVNSDTVTPEQIVCAPSLPGSPPLTPSPKRNSASPRGILSASPNSLLSSHHLQQQILLRQQISAEITARMSEPMLNTRTAQLLDKQTLEQLALNISSVVSSAGAVNPVLSPKAAAAAAANLNLAAAKKSASGNVAGTNAISASTSAMPIVQPQIFVKQGVSKCKECNIVFCKYENYLAHKKHYCSARNFDETKDGKNKPSPPTSPSNNIAGGTGAYQQLICAACGIKFTSLDNLSAHQLYYCPKRVEMSVQVRVDFHFWLWNQSFTLISFLVQCSNVQQVKEKCGKCKTVHDHNQSCPSSQNLFKCPICDVVSSNAAEARRHLETHSNVKAFRCSICRYKGNTLR